MISPIPDFHPLEARLLFTTFTVTSANDTGAGSLRQAIADANNHAGVNTLHFDLPADAHTIRPNSVLPTITSPLILDGTTSPGTDGSTLVTLDGTNAGGVNGLNFSVNGNTVINLLITRFSGIGLKLIGSNDVVQSNIIISNGKDGLLIDGGNNTIGGASKGLGNTFSGNGTGGSGFGISTSSSGGDSFFRNEIRSNASGGILVKSSNEHTGNGDVSN